MIKAAFIFLASIILFSSCATQHKSLSGIREWSYPENQLDEHFLFNYVDNILSKTNNNRAARWAKRKNIHVISIRLINNTEKPIHGTQLSFFNGNKKAEVIPNRWLAKKVRQRFSPLMILWLPVFMIESALWPKYDNHSDNFWSEDDGFNYISMEVAKESNNMRKNANFNLRHELLNFQLATQILEPGKIVYGIVGIRCKNDLKDLIIVSNEAKFNVISNYNKE